MTKKEVIVPADDLVCLGKDTLQELIRCKDCKHYYALNEVRGNCSEYNFVEKIPIDYCSWAERKEE